MTFDEIIEQLPLLTGTVFGVGIFILFISLRLFRRSRRAPYWADRRRAGQRGLQVFMFASALLAASMILCAVTLIIDLTSGSDSSESANNQSVDADNTVTEESSVVIEVTAPAMATEAVTEQPATQPVTPAGPEEVTEEPSAEATQPVTPMITASPEPESTIEPTEMPASLTTVAPLDVSTEAPTEIITEEPAQPTLTVTETPEPVATATPTLTITPTVTPVTPTATETVQPSATVTASPTLTATVTPTITPSPTITPEAVTVAVEGTLPVPRTTPARGAFLRINAVSDAIDGDFEPITRRPLFEAGIQRVYFFVEFEQMAAGILWRRELYRDGQYLTGRADLWGIEPSGETFFFFGQNFIPGEYEVRVYVGTRTEPADTIAFTVTE